MKEKYFPGSFPAGYIGLISISGALVCFLTRANIFFNKCKDTFMNKGLILFFLLIPFYFHASAQENAKYRLLLNKDASLQLCLKEGNQQQILLLPEFMLFHRESDPALHYEKYVKEYADGVTVPAWTSVTGNRVTPDYFKVAYITRIRAISATRTGNRITWNFARNRLFTFNAYAELVPGQHEVVIQYEFIPQKDGYYSIAYSGLPATDPKQADAIWQPWIWQEKRFPLTSYLSTEEMCPLPATMLEKKGITYGIIADPAMLPFRFPSLKEGNIRFGALLRNNMGKAQPMIFAPVLGNTDSKMKTGLPYSFRTFVLFDNTDLAQMHRHAVEKIYGFSDYRSNVFSNLNQTLANMVHYAMDDVNSGWNAGLKGFDYAKDVAQTIKSVSGLHPLSLSVIMDNEDMYRRRAVPMIGFNLSRERFLFTVHPGAGGQNASGNMNGPGLEVAELGALYNYYQGKMPVFGYWADSLKNSVRVLNLNTKSYGDSWQNLAGLYKIGKDSAYLREAIVKAKQYIKRRMDTVQTDFNMAGVDDKGTLSSGDLTSQFTTDYTPRWIELLNLYELTHDKEFLDASLKGAKLFTQFIWFSPVIPPGNIKLDSLVVPAWRLSQIGLTPEASNTFNHNPAIYLSHFAAHFLRLACYTGDTYFRDIARSAIIGRYSNFPGYTYGKFSTIQSRPDYPTNPSLHGSFYYNHIWPQIALLADYLISDAFAQSKQQIQFPGLFVPAYAYLKSNVYGYAPGKFYTDEGVYLYMPEQLLQLDNEQVNYISGYRNDRFYICLLNQCDSIVHVSVGINPALTSLNASSAYNAKVWKENKQVADQQVNNGKISLEIAPKGITAVAIEGLTAAAVFQNTLFNNSSAPSADTYKIVQSPYGKISSALFVFGKSNSSAYVWLEAGSLKKAVLYYRFADNEEWQQVVDTEFPYEFNVALPGKTNRMQYKVELTGNDGIFYTTGLTGLTK